MHKCVFFSFILFQGLKSKLHYIQYISILLKLVYIHMILLAFKLFIGNFYKYKQYYFKNQEKKDKYMIIYELNQLFI